MSIIPKQKPHAARCIRNSARLRDGDGSYTQALLRYIIFSYTKKRFFLGTKSPKRIHVHSRSATNCCTISHIGIACLDPTYLRGVGIRHACRRWPVRSRAHLPIQARTTLQGSGDFYIRHGAYAAAITQPERTSFHWQGRRRPRGCSGW